MLKKRYVKYLLVVLSSTFIFPTFTKQSKMEDFMEFYYSMTLDQAEEVLNHANSLDYIPFYANEIENYATEKGQRLYLSGGIAHRMIDYMNWNVESIELLNIQFESKEDKQFYTGEVEVTHKEDGVQTYPVSGFLEIKRDGLSWKIDNFEEENYLYNQLMNKYE